MLRRKAPIGHLFQVLPRLKITGNTTDARVSAGGPASPRGRNRAGGNVLRKLAIAAAILCLGACTTTAVKTAAPSAISAPVANSKVLVVEPDVQLSLLTAAGLQEARQDWSQQGHNNLSASLK